MEKKKSKLIQGLEDYLNNTSEEQLKKDWAELEQYNQYGPEVKDCLELGRQHCKKDVTMIQKDKQQLLLQDLCARLPYSPICHIVDEDGVDIDDILTTSTINHFDVWVVEPYLRPMSSMTKEEKEELVDFGLAFWDNGKYTDDEGNTIIYGEKEIQLIPYIETYDWLNKHHLDYRGLIPMGLAIAVTKENNPYK